MKKIVLLCLFSQLVFSQIGINTTSPQETLHVEGTFRATNTTSVLPSKLSGLDTNGTLTDVVVGDNLELSGNRLNAISSVTSSPAYYLVATINVTDGPPNEEFDDFDLLLGGVNSDKVVFRLVGRTSNYKITGISGGTDGRHIVLFNVSTSNMSVDDQATGSLAENRIITLGNNVATSGQGTGELVYDGALQRWILIGFRD